MITNTCCTIILYFQMDIPWRSFFTSGPVWGIIITHGLANFGTYTFMTNMPTYMKEVLKFDIKSVSMSAVR